MCAQDIYVFPENVIAWIATLDGRLPGYYGWRFSYEGDDAVDPVDSYASGNGGYVITRSALARTKNMSLPECSTYADSNPQRAGIITRKKYHFVGNYEDVFMGRCMMAAGVALTHSANFNYDSLGRMLTEAASLGDYEGAHRALKFPATFRMGLSKLKRNVFSFYHSHIESHKPYPFTAFNGMVRRRVFRLNLTLS